MSEWCRSLWAALALLLVCGVSAAQTSAQTGADAYLAAVPIAEQSNAELHRAAAVGLREVVVRVSGQSDAVRAPAVANALGDAERFLDQYRFERNSSTEPGALPWLAQLRFGQSGVAQLLRGAGLPVWAGNRPVLLVWLVQDDGSGRRFVDEQAPLAAALREQARRRGLTLRFPKDFSALTVDDAWQLDTAKLRSGATAGGEIALLGHIAQASGGRSSGAWKLAAANEQPTLQAEGDNAASYLAQSIDRVADALAQQYATVATATAGATLRVDGIESFNDYIALLTYLKQVGAIKAANPTQIAGSTVILQLKLEGGAEQLARQLALDNRLLLDQGSDASSATLNCRWQAARG
ncbi:MAG TPA: DUF2066 domain-containing protein [Spongiibacteraceae bacterium]|nr:DUF2066 domain-containing protein [Spongiibacteraceae bacterium]